MAFKLARFHGELSVAALRVSSIAVGPIAALAIASQLSPVEQGYYYSFVSILAARAAFDAGVTQVIVNTTGQEGRSLTVYRERGLEGPEKAVSCLRDIFHFALRWYAIAASVMLIVVGGAGYTFFDTGSHTDVAWKGPWISFIALGCLDFAMLGFWAVLEGLNQIVYTYLMRTAKSVLSALLLATVIFLHGRLWSVAAFMGASVLVNLVLIYSWRKVFLSLGKKAEGTLSWQQAIWPFQWRMAVSWIGGYLAVPLFVPILFRVSGAPAAGRVGMTMAVLNAATSLAQAVIDAKVPPFCGLIASKLWGELDHRYFQRAVISLGLLFAALVGAVVAIFALDLIGIKFSTRIVSWPIFVVFALAITIGHIVQLEATYLRSHRREPLMWLSVLGGLLSAPITYALARWSGPLGVGIGYLGVGLLFNLPGATAILVVLRKRWHAPTRP